MSRKVSLVARHLLPPLAKKHTISEHEAKVAAELEAMSGAQKRRRKRESGGAKVASAFRSQTHSIDFRIVYVGFRIVGGESVEVSEEGGGKVVNLMVLSSKSEFG